MYVGAAVRWMGWDEIVVALFRARLTTRVYEFLAISVLLFVNEP